tara:strand:- start:6181 stop:6729 length:549 start_codon:yes stop_codon:yes gene_type:complete
MINPQTQESFKELQSLSETNLPVPGQSLTNDPDTPLPFEQAPVHVELSPAIDDLLVRLCQPEIFQGIVGALADGVPVAEMAEQILFEGFVQGQYNPDLMLLLVEPVMYILISFADMVDIEPRIDDEDEDTPEEQLSNIEQAMEKAKENFVPTQVPSSIKTKVEQLTENIDIKPKSLLSKEEE